MLLTVALFYVVYSLLCCLLLYRSRAYLPIWYTTALNDTTKFYWSIVQLSLIHGMFPYSSILYRLYGCIPLQNGDTQFWSGLVQYCILSTRYCTRYGTVGKNCGLDLNVCPSYDPQTELLDMIKIHGALNLPNHYSDKVSQIHAHTWSLVSFRRIIAGTVGVVCGLWLDVAVHINNGIIEDVDA
jgi:hypothetical protein